MDNMNFRSKGEQELYRILEWRLKFLPNLKVQYEYKLNKLGCPRNLSIDFMILNQWDQPLLAIECQGEQHYEDKRVIERDNFKAEWLHDNCIAYLPIPWRDNKLRFEIAMQNHWNRPLLAEEEDFRFLLEDLDELAKEKITYPLEERKEFRKQQAEELAKSIKEYYNLK